jgi:hypothetical protein
MPRKVRDKTSLVQLKIRMRESLRARLEEEASFRGVSINAEAIDRLAYTFDRGDLLTQVVTLAFGERLGGLLIALGLAMAAAAATAPPEQGRRILQGADWTSDPTAYDAAVFAATVLLDCGRPKNLGNSAPFTEFAFLAVEELIAALNGKEGDLVLGHRVRANAIRSLIGPVAERMGEGLVGARKARELVARTKFGDERQATLAGMSKATPSRRRHPRLTGDRS